MISVTLIAFILLAILKANHSASIMKATSQTAKINPTLLISLDGFRADKLDEFLKENPNSFLQKNFVEVGIKAEYMKPAYPSNTFPNHVTLVTGLYPESHGIVNNKFYDSNYQEKVDIISGPNADQYKWWNGSEPVWVTAKNSGLKTSSFFWTGSDIWPQVPDVFFKYNNNIKFEERCNEVVKWFQKFQMDFSTLYFNEPDLTGHYFGPDSKEYKDKIKELDNLIGYLLTKLSDAGQLENLNIVIVSDHGMTSILSDFLLEKYIDVENLVDKNKTVIYEAISNIYPKSEAVREKLYEDLNKISPKFKAYYKDELPAKFHFQKGNRIAPIIVVADEGYSLSDIEYEKPLLGNHGFDNDLPSMRSIFLARGPNFKKNQITKPINAVDIYPLTCHLLNIRCHPNNGSLENFLAHLEPTKSFGVKLIANPFYFIILMIIVALIKIE